MYPIDNLDRSLKIFKAESLRSHRASLSSGIWVKRFGTRTLATVCFRPKSAGHLLVATGDLLGDLRGAALCHAVNLRSFPPLAPGGGHQTDLHRERGQGRCPGLKLDFEDCRAVFVSGAQFASSLCRPFGRASSPSRCHLELSLGVPG